MGLRTVVAILFCAPLAGCGFAGGSERPDQTAALLLDRAPSGVHAGIFSAVRRGYDEAEGVHLRVRTSRHPTRALRAGDAAFAIVHPRDLGHDLLAVLALTQTPAGEPGLVVAATRQTVDTDPVLVGATVRAIARGYRFTLSDPESSAEDVVASSPRTDPARVSAQLDRLDAAFVGPSGHFGVLPRGPAFAPRFAAQAAREQSG